MLPKHAPQRTKGAFISEPAEATSGRPLVTDRGDAESERGLARGHAAEHSRTGALSPNSQPRVAPCGCKGSCGLLFLQRDPAYLSSAVCVEGKLMLRAQREEGALRAQELRKNLPTPRPDCSPAVGPSGDSRAWHPASPQPTCLATQGRWPSCKHPRAGLRAPYHLEGESSVGGSDLAILSSTRMGLSSWWGGSIWAISISVMPSDQMSAL